MLRRFVFVFVILCLALSAFAQNAPLPSTTITTNFEAVTLPGLGPSFPATIGDVGVSFTPDLNLFAETLQSPGIAGFNGAYGGGASCQLNYLSKALNDASPVLSGFKVRFTLTGSIDDIVLPNANHIGVTARFRTDYALSAGGMWNFGVEIGAARLPGLAKGFVPIVAFGVPIRF